LQRLLRTGESSFCSFSPSASRPFAVGPSAAAGVRAILDALKPLGIDHIDMPATPSRVWQAINERIAARAAE
jgi:hypothetical protein